MCGGARTSRASKRHAREQHGRQYRECEREKQTRAIDDDFVESRNLAGLETETQVHRDVCEREPQGAAQCGSQDALGHEPTCDTELRRAECALQCDFPPLPLRAHERQVRRVRPRDEQQESGGPEQQQERRAHVADDRMPERCDDCSESHLLELLRRDIGICVGQRTNQAIQVTVDLVGRYVAREARDAAQVEPVHARALAAKARGLFLRRPAEPHLRLAVREVEAARGNADHYVGPAIDLDRAADDRRIRAVPSHPQVVADERAVAPVELEVVRSREATDVRRRAEHVEEARRHHRHAHLFGRVDVRQRTTRVHVRRDIVQRAAVLAVMQIDP